METAIEPTQTKVIQAPATPMELIAQAMNLGLGVDQLERLMGLQERYEKQQAITAFFHAFNKFQANVPDLRKTKEVQFNGKPQYSFTPLASITRQISKPLQDAELSYRWEISDTKEELKVTCLISHILGHTERTTMSAAPDPSGSKNGIQARGSSITYLQRYTLIAALGLSTADADVDGNIPTEYDMDKLHKDYMEIYNEVIQIDSGLSKYHPDNWKKQPTGAMYAKAIGEIRKVLHDLQQKNK
jgi:hypothetical protein